MVGAAAAYPLGAMGLVWVWFPLLFFQQKKTGFGRLYARRARHKCCALYTPRSRFALVNFLYQTLVFRFLEFCLEDENERPFKINRLLGSNRKSTAMGTKARWEELAVFLYFKHKITWINHILYNIDAIGRHWIRQWLWSLFKCNDAPFYLILCL